MLVGWYGMLAAAEDVYPYIGGEIREGLSRSDKQIAPWDVK